MRAIAVLTVVLGALLAPAAAVAATESAQGGAVQASKSAATPIQSHIVDREISTPWRSRMPSWR